MNNTNPNSLQRTPLGIKNLSKNKNIIEDKVTTNNPIKTNTPIKTINTDRNIKEKNYPDLKIKNLLTDNINDKFENLLYVKGLNEENFHDDSFENENKNCIPSNCDYNLCVHNEFYKNDLEILMPSEPDLDNKNDEIDDHINKQLLQNAINFFERENFIYMSLSDVKNTEKINKLIDSPLEFYAENE